MALENLNQFTGTLDYHRFNVIARNVLLTDGALYLANEAGAFWLMDIIASYIKDVEKACDGFAVAKLVVNDDESALFTLTDGNNDKPLRKQNIGFTDFPLKQIDLFVSQAEGMNEETLFIIMLPSEY